MPSAMPVVACFESDAMLSSRLAPKSLSGSSFLHKLGILGPVQLHRAARWSGLSGLATGMCAEEDRAGNHDICAYLHGLWLMYSLKWGPSWDSRASRSMSSWHDKTRHSSIECPF